MPVRFVDRVHDHLAVMYPHAADEGLVTRVLDAVGIESTALGDGSDVTGGQSRWDESTSVVITYGDMLSEAGELPLRTLGRSLGELVGDVFTHLHVLPFFPSSSDDGFAVIDHRKVDPALGTWTDIVELGRGFTLMSDLVVNHVSAQGAWFEQFVDGVEPGRSYLLTAAPDGDLGSVVRPRTHPLLREVETAEGVRHVWCTFSHDQADLDFRNPDVLCEMLRVIDRLLATGTRWLRLDAVAYVWKEYGTRCLHLPQTHELVRLFNTLLEVRAPDAVVVTETNVPHKDNVAYFGTGDAAGDEAHVVYNFSLAPLVLHTLLNGSSVALQRWVAGTASPVPGTTFLNFIASHDGIGLRPAEGLLDEDEIDRLVGCALEAGGRVSDYATADGSRPYELNVSLFELWGPADEPSTALRHVAAH
ncbi:MAG: alpha-amylase family glycosyl hydrolase, partial [Actinomycetota bacterium]|nr:alpha-amylase family glycosyl hydrolase [Actinomycetota bacterium]